MKPEVLTQMAEAKAKQDEVKVSTEVDTRHHNTIIKDIRESDSLEFVAKYLNDSREGVKKEAESKHKELTK
jgi:hypothetical protein